MKDILSKIKEMGFDGVVSIPVNKVKDILMDHAERSNSDISKALEMIKEASSVLVLTSPFYTFHNYPENTPRVSGYYHYLQDAYSTAQDLSQWLSKNGNNSIVTYGLPQKSLGASAGLGRFGRNNLLIRKGPHIMIQTLICKEDTGLNWITYEAGTDFCDKCKRCEKACPSGALKDRTYTRFKCIRAHMGNQEAPEQMVSLIGERLLGCDECLNACPGKKTVEVTDKFKEVFTWDNILDEENFEKLTDEINYMIGVNFARELSNSPIISKAKVMY